MAKVYKITNETSTPYGKRKTQKVGIRPGDEGPIQDWRKGKNKTLVRAFLGVVWPLDDVIPFPSHGGEYRLERPAADCGGEGYWYDWHPSN